MSSPNDIAAPVAAASAARTRLPDGKQRRWRFRPALLAGRGNRVEGSGLGAWFVRLTTQFYGPSSDNLVQLGRNLRTKGLVVEIMGNGNRVEIGDDVRLSGKIVVRGQGLRVRIGARCDIKRCKIVACKADVTIGSDCLIGAGASLRTSDMHRIADRTNGRTLNRPRPVVVGTGVWLAAEAALLKGAHVPDGCVVGFRSTVTRGFDEPDCVLAGSPARVVRHGIAWSR